MRLWRRRPRRPNVETCSDCVGAGAADCGDGVVVCCGLWRNRERVLNAARFEKMTEELTDLAVEVARKHGFDPSDLEVIVNMRLRAQPELVEITFTKHFPKHASGGSVADGQNMQGADELPQ